MNRCFLSAAEHTPKVFLTLFLGLALFTSTAAAQITVGAVSRANWADSSARNILAHYSGARLTQLPGLMRQQERPLPAATVREILNSLTRTALAQSDSGKNPIINLLWSAGEKSLLAERGSPVPGVLSKLIEIDQALGTRMTNRSTGLRAMLKTPEHTRALNYLLRVITTEDGVDAMMAVIIMIDDVRPKKSELLMTTSPGEIAETKQVLRDLWDKYSAEPFPSYGPDKLGPLWPSSTVIPNDDAVKQLWAYASEQGWGGGRKRGN